jgi:D-alanine--poly(phosphoribitol) ligase subunit 1
MRFDFTENRFVETGVAADAWAVVGSDRALRWSELAAEASAWCDAARAHGYGADVPVILRGHKEAGFVVAITGALMLGAPFVPVDMIYPDERMLRIADELRTTMYYDVVSGEFAALRVGQQETVTEGGAVADDSDAVVNKPGPALQETGLAYVLFTSGTTGTPKGVQIGRESVQGLVEWMKDFELGNTPVFLNHSLFSFDVSLYDVIGMLTMGGTAVLVSRALGANSEALLTSIVEHDVTTWVSTPSFAQQQMLNPQFSSEGLKSLRTFLFCGEALPVTLARRLRQLFPAVRIINTYGPTEATVATTWIEVDDALLAKHPSLPIGWAKRDSEVFVDAGELCIAGPHVMRGYLNRSDLNTTRMFSHNGQRAFRTGDVGSVDADGLLFCQGRIDDQVKLNGYRIELQEIDAALGSLPGVPAAAAVALRRADGSVARIVAFVETGEEGTALPAQLHDWKALLAARLPSYMIPSELLGCRGLPVSVNYKIDRTRLAQNYRDAHLKV